LSGPNCNIEAGISRLAVSGAHAHGHRAFGGGHTRLDPRMIGLAVDVYQPQVHYMQVRDAWAGTGNPDGR
jgi:hypothetical protein